MSDQEQTFITPGYDPEIYDCPMCLDSGISPEDNKYCDCRMGKRIENTDLFSAQLKSRGLTEAARMVFRSTQRTEKAIAMADKALLLDKISKLERKVTETEQRAFTMSEQLDDMAKQLHAKDIEIAQLIHEKAQASLGWLPIETAPKDGTLILVLVEGYEPSVARWRAGCWMTAECEADYEDGEYDFSTKWELTHWMNLPSYPAPTLKEKE